jgi:hypothetical protein
MARPPIIGRVEAGISDYRFSLSRSSHLAYRYHTSSIQAQSAVSYEAFIELQSTATQYCIYIKSTCNRRPVLIFPEHAPGARSSSSPTCRIRQSKILSSAAVAALSRPHQPKWNSVCFLFLFPFFLPPFAPASSDANALSPGDAPAPAHALSGVFRPLLSRMSPAPE